MDNQEAPEMPARGLGEREETPDGGLTVGDAMPEMPAGWDAEGGGLTADDTAQPTTSADVTGDRATGLMGLRGG